MIKFTIDPLRMGRIERALPTPDPSIPDRKAWELGAISLLRVALTQDSTWESPDDNSLTNTARLLRNALAALKPEYRASDAYHDLSLALEAHVQYLEWYNAGPRTEAEVREALITLSKYAP